MEKKLSVILLINMISPINNKNIYGKLISFNYSRHKKGKIYALKFTFLYSEDGTENNFKKIICSFNEILVLNIQFNFYPGEIYSFAEKKLNEMPKEWYNSYLKKVNLDGLREKNYKYFVIEFDTESVIQILCNSFDIVESEKE